MLILISSLAGTVVQERSGCKSRTRLAMVVAMAVLIGAVIMSTDGNFLAEHLSAD